MTSLEETITRIVESDSHWTTLTHGDEPIDPDTAPTTFAVLVGPGDDRESAMIVEITINADNTGAICNVTSFQDGEPARIDLLELGQQFLLTCPF